MKKLISFCKEHMFRIVVIILLVGILGNTIYLQFSLLQVKQKAEMALAGTYVIARYLNIIPFSQPSGKLMADKDIESRFGKWIKSHEGLVRMWKADMDSESGYGFGKQMWTKSERLTRNQDSDKESRN